MTVISPRVRMPRFRMQWIDRRSPIGKAGTELVRRHRALPRPPTYVVLCATVGVKELSVNHGADQVRFSVSAPSAKRVSLVGDFDGWNPSAVPMRRASSDVWVVDVRLQPGRHVFAFSIDGALRADSTAPRAVEDDFGVPGSVIVVPEPERGTGSD